MIYPIVEKNKLNLYLIVVLSEFFEYLEEIKEKHLSHNVIKNLDKVIPTLKLVMPEDLEVGKNKFYKDEIIRKEETIANSISHIAKKNGAIKQEKEQKNSANS